jgi:thymidine phosphorylase
MDVPLGFAVGNALEVRESVEVLAGGGPVDVVELTVLLAREMLDLAGIAGVDPAVTLQDGRAMDAWRRMVRAQGGDPDAALPSARESQVVLADSDGVVTRVDALGVGVAAWRLGAGRARKEDPVSAGAGILLHAKPGDVISRGDRLLTMFTDEPARFPLALEALDGALGVGPVGSTIERLPLVVGRVG